LLVDVIIPLVFIIYMLSQSSNALLCKQIFSVRFLIIFSDG